MHHVLHMLAYVGVGLLLGSTHVLHMLAYRCGTPLGVHHDLHMLAYVGVGLLLGCTMSFTCWPM